MKKKSSIILMMIMGNIEKIKPNQFFRSQDHNGACLLYSI